jgi:DNA-binding transcriptional ArsR family regulator
MVKALSHPTRLEILMTLQGRIASPAELAQQMDKSIGVISYHARTLVQCGCLELIHSEPRQGSVENFFGIASHSSL